MSLPKRRPLNVAALGAAAIPQPDPVHEANRPRPVAVAEESSVLASTSKRAASREGMVQIQGYYPVETRRRLKVLAAKMGKSQEALLGVALEYLFEKHDR